MKDRAKYKDVIRILVLVLCGLVLGINVYSINAKNVVGNQLPMPFGIGAAVVLSGSMEPEFSQGDLLIAKQCDEYNTNDIVIYQEDDHLVSHRIIHIDDDSVITQGDANNVSDEPIRKSDIRAKVVFWIPGAGNVVTFLKTPVGIFTIIFAAIALIEIPRVIERKKDDEERQKIIDEIKKLKEEQYDE